MLAAALLARPAAAGHADRAPVFMTQAQALAQAFPGDSIRRLSLILTDAEAAAVEARARARLESRIATAYVAHRGDTLAGTAFFDTRIVRTMPAVFMVVVGPDTAVRRVDVLAFHEPPDYRPLPRWLALFEGRRLDGRASTADVRTLSGATLSARAVGTGVRLALALYEVVVAPRLAAEGGGQPRSGTGGGTLEGR